MTTKLLLNKNEYEYQSWGEKFPLKKLDIKKLINVDPSWIPIFEDFYKSNEYKGLNTFFEFCLMKTNGDVKIFPYPDLVFNSFCLTPLDEIKVVLIGQDPYFNHELVDGKIVPQAMGLSFSIPVGIKIPSSLNNVFSNMKKFGHLDKDPEHGNLESWSWQGVLLLNRALTVQAGHPNSQARYWEDFTLDVIKYISANCSNLVFLLWGSPAQSVESVIDSKKHYIIKSSHPSGLSANKPCGKSPAFMEVNHFGLTNDYLKSVGKGKINWQSILI